MEHLEITYEQWEVLFRERLMVERGLLQMMAGVTDRPRELTEVTQKEMTDLETAKLHRPRWRFLLAPAGLATVALAIFIWHGLSSRR